MAISPVNLKATLIQLIEDEIAHAKAGRPAQIWAKLNSLVDETIIDSLYKASQSGVSIQLVIRGICCLRPGVAGLSDNIEVRSMVGRFLEHARIFHFKNGGDEEVYLSSADWMPPEPGGRLATSVPALTNPSASDQFAAAKDVLPSFRYAIAMTQTPVGLAPG